MATNYIGPGNVLDHTAGSALSSGDKVVLGAAGNVSVGVVLKDIANGAVGPVAIEGRFSFPKVSGAVIAQGESVNWDASAGAVDDNAAVAATGDVSDFAVAAEAAGSGVTTIDVILKPGNGAIT